MDSRKFMVLRNLNKNKRSIGMKFIQTLKTGFENLREDERPIPSFSVETVDKNLVRDLKQDPEVVAIARSMPLKHIQPVTMDNMVDYTDKALQNNCWGLEAIGVNRTTLTGKGVTVAVLDTGIERNHIAFQRPDLEIIEKDFTGEGNGDKNGHGTHCAGTIFGGDVQGRRIGVARGVNRALIGKVLGEAGGDSIALIEALNWALGEQADVISMSLGYDFPAYAKGLSQTMPLEAAVSKALQVFYDNVRLFEAFMVMNTARMAFDGGAVVVAAAGNESNRDATPPYEIHASLPSATENVISVGALKLENNGLYSVAPFSNTRVDVVAAGMFILSADAKNVNGLRILSGTSMACPHVAGFAALHWEDLRNTFGDGGVTAKSVAQRVQSFVRTDNFIPNIDLADIGNGYVTF